MVIDRISQADAEARLLTFNLYVIPGLWLTSTLTTAGYQAVIAESVDGSVFAVAVYDEYDRTVDRFNVEKE